jgi:hypothetical protein
MFVILLALTLLQLLIVRRRAEEVV